jgi:uracil-DNA glycosylase family 4
MEDSLAAVEAEVVACRACPRLVAWRERVAAEKVARFRADEYWARPVPGFGDPDARIVLVGLAPAAHGGNRTGRVFTGDRSGDFLFAALHRCGFANQPTATHRGDGLVLSEVFITAAVKCAPPANKPTPVERDTCRPYLERELALLERATVLVAIGQFGWDAVCSVVGARPRPRFGHGAEAHLPDGRWLLGTYHVSQQNTFTGKLTEPMLDAVLRRASELAVAIGVEAERPPPVRGLSVEEGDELAGEVQDRGGAEEARHDEAEPAVGGGDGEVGAHAGSGDDADDQGGGDPPVDVSLDGVGDRAGDGERADARQ